MLIGIESGFPSIASLNLCKSEKCFVGIVSTTWLYYLHHSQKGVLVIVTARILFRQMKYFII
jgi:hypothetical protein